MDDIEVVDANVDVPESDANARREGGGMAIASSPRSRSRSRSPLRRVSLSPMIQNYQTRALSDTDESKNTHTDKTDRPRFGYPGPSSQHCQRYL